MYYEVEWTEDGVRGFKRVFKAKNLSTIAKSLRYMNCEREYGKRPLMKSIQITEMEDYDGEYEEVTGCYYEDLILDMDAPGESIEKLWQ